MIQDLLVIEDWTKVLYLVNKKESYKINSQSDIQLVIRAVKPNDIYVHNEFDGFSALVQLDIWKHVDSIILLMGTNISLGTNNKNDYISISSEINYDIILNHEEINKYSSLGEEGYLKDLNSNRFINVYSIKNSLLLSLKKYSSVDTRFKEIQNELSRIEKWIEIYSKWFLRNGFEIPEIVHEKRDVENDDVIGLPLDIKPNENEKILTLENENKKLNIELSIRNEKIKDLVKKVKIKRGDITVEDLKKIIDDTRKNNKKPNYSKIGKRLGIGHETAKRLITDKGLDSY
jgi:hypothetical protein